MKSLIIYLTVFSSIIVFSIGDESKSFISKCTSLQNCFECITTPGCAWCSKSDFHGGDKKRLARCNTTEGHKELGNFQCPSKALFDPQNDVNIIKNAEITGEGPDIIPIKPQEITIKLRKGVPLNITIKYQDPKDYPLDLYYLMDLTYSMKDDKDTIAELGNQLRDKMLNVTKKFRQGFGSFIDKEVMPFILTSPNKLENPCGKIHQCVTPYGFKHHLSVTSDAKEFSRVVQNAQLSATLDKPEGGFDALMQVMVCDEIGFSKEARKLVIFATDSTFHIAGDGKLGGVIRPNDGKCHLNNKGEYTHSTELDYPSISQLNQKAKSNSVNVIFAVIEQHAEIYSKLEKSIEGAKTGVISTNSSNIVELVVEEYKKIKSRIELSDNLPKKHIGAKYYSNCGQQGSNVMKTNACDDVGIRSGVEFSTQLELLECPEEKEEWKKTYEIKRVGLSHGLKINIEMHCDCPCERNEDDWIKKSSNCNNKGTEKCGLCHCDEGHFGNLCQCDATGKTVPQDEEQGCMPEDKNIPKCYGRGKCFCGICTCDLRINTNETYSGKHCECDNFSCEKGNNKLCSGNGNCICGECACNDGWGGSACECSLDKVSCTRPGSDEICSGRGGCECGKCVCKKPYSGLYCEKCQEESCPTKCVELTACVQCKIHGTGVFSNGQDCSEKCSGLYKELNPIDVVSKGNLESDSIFCSAEDVSDDCKFYFEYTEHVDKSITINAQKTKECPPELPIVWILLGVASIIVLIGLICFIVWKVFIVVKDRKEYAEFHNEAKDQKYERTENPLYHNPWNNYNNPAYGKNK